MPQRERRLSLGVPRICEGAHEPTSELEKYPVIESSAVPGCQCQGPAMYGARLPRHSGRVPSEN